MTTATANSSTARDAIDLRRLLVQFALVLIAIIAAMVVLGVVFRDDFVSLGRAFVETLGEGGIFVIFLVPDALTIPIPQDAFMAIARAGGMAFGTVVLWASLGSMIGGSLGWLLGRQLQRTKWYQRVTEKGAVDAEALVRRYGVAALAVGAITPLPYSVICWTCGALGMSYIPFIVVSLLRIPRVALYLALIDFGLVTVLQ